MNYIFCISFTANFQKFIVFFFFIFRREKNATEPKNFVALLKKDIF